MGVDPPNGPPFAIIAIPGSPTVVALKGELDMASAPDLRARLEEIIVAGQHELTLDLNELEFMDSQGINVLLHAREAVRFHNGRLTIRSPQPIVARVLETTGLLKLFMDEE